MLENLKNELKPYYDQLNHHHVYDCLDNFDSIKKFMEIHIYSVWDFMNLLKYLQNKLTCVDLPWVPYRSPKLSRLINEIVLEEESDNIDGEITSHFMYYYRAIDSIGGDADHIETFMNDLNLGVAYDAIIQKPYIPLVARSFMEVTHQFTKQTLLDVAAAFTFGRETLVPTLFEPIKSKLSDANSRSLSQFISYLERHIQLDGEEHSKLAFEMVSLLAQKESDWAQIKQSAIQALNARIIFWDGIADEIKNH